MEIQRLSQSQSKATAESILFSGWAATILGGNLPLASR
ncbi:hypothetical protein SynMINOS11_01897 [Synechococcus sp. Minos11]|nr:hypothetical protein SynMINOS11_01897 [Synechococcus sp. Minos11]